MTRQQAGSPQVCDLAHRRLRQRGRLRAWPFSIAPATGDLSRNTIYNYVPGLKGGRLALARATSTPELPRPARSEG
ncbi:hypothetical protein [Streptomyces sp. NPDC059651]|uniref:hypothetical protein n=1 Tax=Streptomyces sp. NPDC059651 TaxID=3346897 RepID=UPI0036B43173